MLSIGHTPGSGGRPSARSGVLVEVDCARTYAEYARGELERLGHEVAVLAGGRYRWRQEWAAHWADIYVECHCNMGNGDYGLVGYDARSTAGARAAVEVSAALGVVWDGVLARTRAQPCKTTDSDGAQHWTAHMLALLKYVYPGKACGIVYEPGFLDRRDHRPMWTDEGLQHTGIALARGLVAWGAP